MKNIKLHVLGTGYIENDMALMVADSESGGIFDKTSSVERAHIPVCSVLIEHPDGLVLFDTSCSPQAMTGRWPDELKIQGPFYATEEELLLNRIDQLHVKPDDIRYVVASHLHCDHAGGLEFFKKSEIIVQENEFTQVMKLFMLNAANKQEMGAYIWEDINAWLQSGLHWKLIPTSAESVKLLDGVTILNFGSGHAFGVLGLLIELEQTGNVLLSSDTVYTAENYGPPVKLPGFIYDATSYMKAIEKVRSIAAEKNAVVWFGHDKDQFASLIHSPDGFYE